MHGYPVQFLYDKCTIPDHTKGDIIGIIGSLFNNLYNLEIYQKFDYQNALVVDAQTQRNSELWHSRFCDLNLSCLAGVVSMIYYATFLPFIYHLTMFVRAVF